MRMKGEWDLKKASFAVLWTLIGIVVLAIGFFAWCIGAYNKIVAERENVNSAYAEIQTQLQRRADLIPNLVNTVKAYDVHEEKVMSDIANARAALVGAKTPVDQARADNNLTNALSRLLVISENYPNLKADKQFRELMYELSGTENRIAVARRDYNNEVAIYNKEIKTFPGSIFAGMFHFENKDYFQASPGSDKAPVVNFGNNP
jgi:LemA protein